MTATTAAATPTAETFDNWRVVCEGEQCIAQQIVSLKSDAGLQTLLALSLVPTANDRNNLEIKLPFGLDLRPGVVMRVDERTEENLPFLTCMADGCVAVAEATDERIAALQAGANLTVGFRQLGQQQTLAIQASLVGFSAAYARLNELATRS